MPGPSRRQERLAGRKEPAAALSRNQNSNTDADTHAHVLGTLCPCANQNARRTGAS